MKIDYAFVPENESFVAKATGRELRIKTKDTIEVCAAIQGKNAKKAEAYLQAVIDGKEYIPIKKTTKQGGHKTGLKPYGRRPIKAVRGVLGVLKAAIANAEFRGLDIDNCVVVSALALRGRKLRRLKPKGRHAVYTTHLTNVQIFVEEAIG